MKKFITIVGIYMLTAISVYLVHNIFLVIYYNINELEFDSVISGIYTIAGLIGVCTYIIYKKKIIGDAKLC